MTMMNEQMIGQPVYDADGQQLGTVKEVRGAYFKVDAPMQPDYWLRCDAAQRGAGGAWTVMANAEHFDAPEDFETERYAEHTGTGAYARTERTDQDTMKLREERLRTDVERERAGEVQLGKRVTEHTETAQVPVREERVVIERTPVNERPASRPIGESDKTVTVPVERERVVAEKEPVVTEEVGVRKEAVERTQPVQANLRKEELVVEGEGDLIENNPNAPRSEQYEREPGRRT